MITIADLLQFLEQSSLAESIRQSYWLYPFIEIIHITGIVFLVGPAFMFDLRLLGFSKNLSVSSLKRYLLTWSMRGLLLVLPSGVLLFMTNAGTLAYDPVFWLKMTLLILAACNALIFHRIIFRSLPDNEAAMPLAAKAVAVFSLVLWIAIIACGRLLAY